MLHNIIILKIYKCIKTMVILNDSVYKKNNVIKINKLFSSVNCTIVIENIKFK
jgi:hypothetical protein